MAKVMLQVLVSEETHKNILSKLPRGYKSFFVNEAIIAFSKTNEAKFFLKDSFMEDSPVEDSPVEQEKEISETIQKSDQQDDKKIDEW